MEPLDVFTIVVLIAAIIPLALFGYFYGTRPAPGRWYRRRFSNVWKSEEVGVVVMSQQLSLLSILTFIVIVRITGDFPARPWIAFGLYFILVGLFWALLAVLRRTQKATEKKEEDQ